MKRRLKLTVTKIRRQTVSENKLNFRAFCPNCHVTTETLSLDESAKFLEIEKQKLEDLIALGDIHTIFTISESLRICQNSLFKKKQNIQIYGG